jgi:hypothetical protein
MDDTDSIINAESGGNATAQNPNSTASGPGQFIDSTWLSTVKQHAPDVAAGKSDADLLALKNDPQLAAQPQNVALAKNMTAAYAADNQAYLKQNGLPVTPGTTYLAHFAGPAGAAKVLQANPNAPVSDILGAAAVKANPFLQGMTAQGLQAWAAKKMGVQSPVTASQAPAPGAPGTPTAPPAAPLPQQQAPIFAAAAPAAAAPAPAPAFQGAQPHQPIFARQQAPNISALRAALAARAPIFANQGLIQNG